MKNHKYLDLIIKGGSVWPSTSLYYISLSLGFGNIAQGGDPDPSVNEHINAQISSSNELCQLSYVFLTLERI